MMKDGEASDLFGAEVGHKLAQVLGSIGRSGRSVMRAASVACPARARARAIPFYHASLRASKRGWRALVVSDARATEKMVPDVEGEFPAVRTVDRIGHA